jgi:uncharacterized membrane protein YeaQ/YmgE (transglycosylase-associated protein family)
MDMMGLLINLISGAVGGNIAGALAKNKSLGPLINTILGLVGGGLGTLVANGTGITQSAGTAGSAGTSAVLGALIPLIAGMLKPKAA